MIQIFQSIFNFDPYLGFLAIFLCFFFAGWMLLTAAERVTWWLLGD